MALEEFEREEMSEKNKGYVRMKSIMDYGMGLLWLGMGVFLVFIKYFNTGFQARFDDPVMKIFGGVCLVYGLFRIYRGYKKNYFIER
ncbi:MAG: hypothetical protein ACOYLO_06480 [Ferruginibacter sp.]|jgi:hypothetical protein